MTGGENVGKAKARKTEGSTIVECRELSFWGPITRALPIRIVTKRHNERKKTR